MTRQYSEAKTATCPPAATACTSRNSPRSPTGCTTAKGCSSSTAWRCRRPIYPAYRERARRFAGLYMGEDPEAPNYDPKRKLIRSMINGSKGPLLRKATALDWVGDPFDATGFVALHGESTYAQFLEHYQEYTDVVGDHFLNLVATTLPDQRLPADRRGEVPALDRRVHGRVARAHEAERRHHPELRRSRRQDRRARGPVVGQRVRLGLQPGQSGDRPPRGSQPHSARAGRLQQRAARDRRSQIRRRVARHDRRREPPRAQATAAPSIPTMYGADGWYGWQREPWSVGALEVWYWSMSDADRARVGANPWVEFLEGRNPGYPETALERDCEHPAQARGHPRRPDAAGQAAGRQHARLNPAATDALVRLMLGALVPGREGGLLNARLRYFDPGAPPRRRAGGRRRARLELGDRRTVVTLVNTSASERARRDRPGRRLRRAPVRVGRVERANRARERPRLHRAPRAGRRRDADARDAPLRQSADRQVSVEPLAD